MMTTMIPVESDVLESLLAARQGTDDNWSDIIRRSLENSPKAVSLAEGENPPPLKQAGFDGQKIHYELLGEQRTAPNTEAAMIDIIATLGHLDPSFLSRLAPQVKGSSRNHLAQRPEQVYPRRPDLAHLTKTILPGWYIGTNIANREKIRILRAACTVTGLSSAPICR